MLKANILTLNDDKSNLFLFNLKRYQKSTNINIHLRDDKLKTKDYAKYLGVYIDSMLTWEKQIQMTCSKLQKGIEIIKIMQNFLQKKQLKQLFLNLIKPYINYGTLAWGGATRTHLKDRLWNTCLGRCNQNPLKG